jgi:hypothetical protein
MVCLPVLYSLPKGHDVVYRRSSNLNVLLATTVPLAAVNASFVWFLGTATTHGHQYWV